ncbi:hypothetical protein E2C01_039075 [Portunus trituberculatus]|uniref:Uncharacterized protein n=1 Tax=Portunus trituberculatus TaxID=210409 RepID=A0A5B7FK69_PORTR|nr:hypothetical protein [Portunus trituberculatus]
MILDAKCLLCPFLEAQAAVVEPVFSFLCVRTVFTAWLRSVKVLATPRRVGCCLAGVSRLRQQTEHLAMRVRKKTRLHWISSAMTVFPTPERRGASLPPRAQSPTDASPSSQPSVSAPPTHVPCLQPQPSSPRRPSFIAEVPTPTPPTSPGQLAHRSVTAPRPCPPSLSLARVLVKYIFRGKRSFGDGLRRQVATLRKAGAGRRIMGGLCSGHTTPHIEAVTVHRVS